MAIIKTTGLGTLKDSLLFDSTSNGIHLGVTSATASNLLDDYEEGTWTPNFGSASGSFGSLTFSANGQNGRYTKIGNKVTAWCRTNCTTTTISTASGQFRITGLPFASSNTYDMFAGSSWRGGGSGPATVSMLMISNATYVVPVKTDGTSVQVSDLASGGRNDFTVTITYETA